jgi:hypothetical protein
LKRNHHFLYNNQSIAAFSTSDILSTCSAKVCESTYSFAQDLENQTSMISHHVLPKLKATSDIVIIHSENKAKIIPIPFHVNFQIKSHQIIARSKPVAPCFSFILDIVSLEESERFIFVLNTFFKIYLLAGESILSSQKFVTTQCSNFL